MKIEFSRIQDPEQFPEPEMDSVNFGHPKIVQFMMRHPRLLYYVVKIRGLFK